MLIRKAEKKDLVECEKLVYIPEMQLATGGYMKKDFLEKYLDENFFLVAENNEKIVGLIFGEKIKCQGAMLWMLVVDNNLRGKGIGTLLLKEFEFRLKKIGIQWVILYGFQKNEKVLEFYRKRGFCKGVKSVEFVKDIR